MVRLLPSNALPTRFRLAEKAGDDYGVSDAPDWRRVDWSLHTREMEIDRRRVTYVDLGAGAGPPVVFIHGLAGCWQNWIENLPRIARARRVVALDLPGFGQSEMPRDRITITNYARTVETLCERLRLGPVVIVGNSMGGLVAADLAARVPRRVARLMLVSAAGLTHQHLLRRPVLVVTRIAMLAANTTVTQHELLLSRARIRHLLLSTIMRHPSRIELDVLLQQAPRSGLGGFMAAIDELIGYDIRERLPEIDCPTLVVQGRNDMLVPVGDAAEYVRMIPDARKAIWDETGHAPMLERPQRFNAELLAFLGERWGGLSGSVAA
jgi:pimeloyl-ACP methyl ester carboxylesterase